MTSLRFLSLRSFWPPTVATDDDDDDDDDDGGDGNVGDDDDDVDAGVEQAAAEHKRGCSTLTVTT